MPITYERLNHRKKGEIIGGNKMKTHYLLENKDGEQKKVSDRAFAIEMKSYGWKLIMTFADG